MNSVSWSKRISVFCNNIQYNASPKNSVYWGVKSAFLLNKSEKSVCTEKNGYNIDLQYYPLKRVKSMTKTDVNSVNQHIPLFWLLRLQSCKINHYHRLDNYEKFLDDN